VGVIYSVMGLISECVLDMNIPERGREGEKARVSGGGGGIM
jgi:hypothetical protein